MPSLFSLALGVERTIGSKLGRRLLTYRPGDELGPVIDATPQRPALTPGQGKLGYDPDATYPAE